jgi:hypothetical protein
VIFALLGFARMTNIAETIAVGRVCIVMAGLSWAAGRAMSYILAEARSGTLFDG